MNPHILLVEDDPTTRAYLHAITEALPASVDAAADMAEALQLARTQRHDLWLIDANLPDGSGIELLGRLRALQPETDALAHTAARSQAELDPLIEAGFAEVLRKPVEMAAWQAAIRRALGAADADSTDAWRMRGEGKRPVWDDEAAARALGGNAVNVSALRGLFLTELPSQLRAIRDGNDQARRDHLHRLHASCAFVGASRLEAAARMLQHDTGDAVALAYFLDTAQDTLSQAPASGT